MSLLIKALDKAQEAKAQEAKAQVVKSQESKAQESSRAVKTKQVEQMHSNRVLAGGALETAGDSATNRKSQTLENTLSKPAANAASAKLAAANALEMELSPIANVGFADKQLYSSVDQDSAQTHSDIPPINSTFSLQEPAASNAAANSSGANNLGANNAGANNKIPPVNNHAVHNKASAKSAANVFAAKRIESNKQNTILALIAGISLCVLLAVAAYFYLFLDRAPDFSPSFSSAKPVATLPENTGSVVNSQAEPNIQAIPNQTIVEPIVEKQSAPLVNEPVTQVNEPAMQTQKPLKIAPNSVQPNLAPPKSAAFREESLAENEVVLNPVLVEKTSGNRLVQVSRNEPRTIEVEQIALKSASIKVSKTKPQMGVNPILMDAFNAYNAGNDAVASKLYRQVLQRDIRNVDALLGLGAIAQRQGRMADANGWYAKVLELEPRNALATSAILDSQPTTNLANQADATNNESRIKSMLAKQPDDANLHAVLGNFYADLNQWPAAQQAYFEAFRLNANADNAFNLAVSLDQLGKPKLALPYYQRALQLAQLGNTAIDKNALEARIAAIQ